MVEIQQGVSQAEGKVDSNSLNWVELPEIDVRGWVLCFKII